MICKKCKEELPVGAEFCPKCGTVVEKRKLTPETEARIQEAMPELREALMLDSVTSDTTLSDEVRIKAAVPILREALRRNFQQGWRCKVCGHQNPRSAVSCVKCGRNRIRTEKLTPSEYDPANMPKPESQEEIVRYVKASEATQPEESKQAQPQSSQAPIVYNYIYPSGYPSGGEAYGVQYAQDTVAGNMVGTPYIAPFRRYTKSDEKHDKTVNRVLAFLLMLLSGGLIYILLSGFPIMNFSEAKLIKPYANGYQLIEAAIYATGGGTMEEAGKAGSIKYCWTDAWRQPFYISGVGLNFGRLIYAASTVLLLVVLLFAVIMFIMNIIRLVTGRIKSNGKSRCHGIILTEFIFLAILALVITIGGSFIPQDADKYPALCGAIDGLTAGIGVYLAASVAFIMFILGFFTKKVRMVNVIENNDNDIQA